MGGWRLVRSNRVRLTKGVHLNFGGGLFPRYRSTSVRLLDGVTWNSKGTLSVALGKGLKLVRNFGRRK